MGGNFFRRKAVLPKNEELSIEDNQPNLQTSFELNKSVDSRKTALSSLQPPLLKPRKKDYKKSRIPAPILSRLPDRNPKSKIRMAVIGKA